MISSQVENKDNNNDAISMIEAMESKIDLLEKGGSPDNNNIQDAYEEASSFSKFSYSDPHRRPPHQLQAENSDGAEHLVRRESRAVRIVRGVLIVLLAVAATLTGVFTYRLSSKNHFESFARDFEDEANRSIQSFKARLGSYMFQASTLSLAMSTGLYTGARPSFPNVSIEDIDDLASSLRLEAGAVDIVWSPLLRNKGEKSRWEAYAKSTVNNGSGSTNPSGKNEPCYVCGEGFEISHPGNTVESADGAATYPCSAVVQAAEAGFLTAEECTLATPFIAKNCGCQKSLTSDGNSTGVNWKISDGVFRLDNNDTAVSEDGPGPYSPVWQLSPNAGGQNAIMFNQMSQPYRRKAIYSMLRNRLPVVSETTYSNTDKFYQLANVPASTTGVHALVFYPVFESTQSNKIVGSLVVDFSWNLLFGLDLSARSNDIVIVLENSCGQVYTFKVVEKVVEFLGEGDLHDPAFDSFEVSSNYNAFQGLLSNAGPKQHRFQPTPPNVACAYRIRVFPSNEFRMRYQSNEPWQLATVVVMIFLFTSLLFLLYDFIVRRIQAKVLDSAKRSEAIVSSLFPAVVRERLFGEGTGQNNAQFLSNTTAMSASRRGQSVHGVMNHKARLKSYLSHPPNVDACQGLEPIADLFPNTTILFADIAGFTAWSSEREPSQVFKLLETLYSAFDQVAKKLGVFKVETIGDCYVAVSGLPEPRKDHAVVMVKFAYECLVLMHDLTRKLEASLGPGTADLNIRVGLHSGPVIAGVLRGERARFQLFGDTMNVASRMESTGKVSQIHISNETAQLLIRAGKPDWVELRDELVSVKGKGQLQTYWVKPQKGPSGGASLCLHMPANPESAPGEDIAKYQQDTSIWGATNLDVALASRTSPSDRRNRLVEWNAELLQHFLQKIVARRTASSKRRSRQGIKSFLHDAWGHDDLNLHIVDEITEVIKMPDFNERAAKEETDPSLIDVGPAVRSQIWEFVFQIAALYRDNAFHNFEHASHVAMSASKLLKRIIAPDDVEYRADESGKKLKCRKILSKEIHESTFGISSDPLMQFAAVFSAVIHDVDHTGLPNKQLVKSQDHLAIKYRNKSVAEQHSVRTAWKLLMEDRFADLRQCIYQTEEDRLRFRQLVINAVIATDIADKELQAWRKTRWDKAFHEERNDSLQSHDRTIIDRKATIVFAYIIQASDVAHTMQHWHIYKKWNQHLFEEQYTAFLQGKGEEDPSLSWFEGELSFFDNYVIPLAKNLEECNVFGVSCDEYLSYALENRHEWALKGEQVVADMVAAFNKRETISK